MSENRNRTVTSLLIVGTVIFCIYLCRPQPVDFYRPSAETTSESPRLPDQVNLAAPAQKQAPLLDSRSQDVLATPDLFADMVEIPDAPISPPAKSSLASHPTNSNVDPSPRMPQHNLDIKNMAPPASHIDDSAPRGRLVNRFYNQNSARSYIPRETTSAQRYAELDLKQSQKRVDEPSRESTFSPAPSSFIPPKQEQLVNTESNSVDELELPGFLTESPAQTSKPSAQTSETSEPPAQTSEAHEAKAPERPVRQRRSVFEETKQESTDFPATDSTSPQLEFPTAGIATPGNRPDRFASAESSFSPAQMNSVPNLARTRRLPESAMTNSVHHIEYGKSLARRGSAYAAHEEFVQALKLLAHAKDSQSQTSQFSRSFAEAMRIIKEAEDFVSAADAIGENSLKYIVEGHATTLVSPEEVDSLGAIGSMQRYLNRAFELLCWSTGQNPVTAEAMFCLGKLNSEIAKKGRTDNMAVAKSIVFHRVALECEPGHFHSANELGALMAKTGQLEQARELFKQSLRVQQHPTTWKNLAAIHAKLGEHQLARLASEEYTRSLSQALPAATQSIQWIDNAAFNQLNENAPHVSVAEAPDNPATGQKRKAFTDWPKRNTGTTGESKSPFKLFR